MKRARKDISWIARASNELEETQRKRLGLSVTNERANRHYNVVTALQCGYTPSHILASSGSIAILHNRYLNKSIHGRSWI